MAGVGAVPVVLPMIVPVPVPVIMAVAGADALDVVMMAGLRQSDLVLEAEHLGAVFAHLAVHVVAAVEDLAQAILEDLQHQRVVVEIAGLDETDLGMGGGDAVGVVVDALDQDRSEEHTSE